MAIARPRYRVLAPGGRAEDAKLAQHGGLVLVYWHLDSEDGDEPAGGDWFDAAAEGSNHSNNTLQIRWPEIRQEQAQTIYGYYQGSIFDGKGPISLGWA